MHKRKKFIFITDKPFITQEKEVQEEEEELLGVAGKNSCPS